MLASGIFLDDQPDPGIGGNEFRHELAFIIMLASDLLSLAVALDELAELLSSLDI